MLLYTIEHNRFFTTPAEYFFPPNFSSFLKFADHMMVKIALCRWQLSEIICRTFGNWSRILQDATSEVRHRVTIRPWTESFVFLFYFQERLAFRPAAVIQKHLQCVPDIVPEYIKSRSHRHQRIGESQGQKQREHRILLSKRLAAFPPEIFAAQPIAADEIRQADQQGNHRNSQQQRPRQVWIAVEEK